MKTDVKAGIANRKSAYRNPMYLFYAIIGLSVLLLSALVAEGGAGPVEVAIFRAFNHLPDSLELPFHIVSLFGTIGMVFLVSFIAVLRKHYANAVKIIIGGVSAYLAAYGLKQLNIRPRPVELIDNVDVREASDGTFGFPSGHVAVAAVLAMTAYQYLPKRWHRPVTILAFLVAISRLYLGVHLPMDLIGGMAIGLIFGGIINFILGSRKFSPVDPEIVRDNLSKLGVEGKSVKLASVDARGSIPYFGELKNGTKVFIKIVGRENNIADWLFKSWRKIIYRRLEDETPFLSAKRQLEHEAYVSSMALLAGVRTPQVIGIFETEKDRWAHAQVAIPGKSLDKVPVSKLTDKVLAEIWKQVEVMHGAGIVHRDLRCANVFLDEKSIPWIIDFGFSEASMPEESKNRDRAELIASMATLVGVERSVNAALKALGKERIQDAARYLTPGVLSSATVHTLKETEVLLPDIRSEIAKKTKAKPAKTISLQRFNFKQLFVIAIIVVAFFALVPHIEEFRQSLDSLTAARWWLVGVSVIFSVLTYLGSAASYRALLYVPIEYSRILLIQIASSFASKLAPAGTGGLALNARFLTKNDHSISQATSIAAINNILGLAAHLSLLVLVILLGASSFEEAFTLEIRLSPTVRTLIIAGLLTVAGLLFALPKVRSKLAKFGRQLGSDLAKYSRQPAKLFGSFASSIIVTLAYTGALYASAHALGSTLSPLQILVIFTVGVATASVTPTPGGLGGAEAGLVAALTATGMDSSQALAITLLYRLVTYWLPIIPGLIAFRYSVNKGYV